MKIQQPPKKKTTYVAIVLDKSSSMAADRDTTISSYNEQVQTLNALRDKNHDVFITLILFSYPEKIERVYLKENIDKLPKLNRDTYMPNGMTALTDAMMFGIKDLELQMKLAGPEDAALMITITDGEENASKVHKASAVKEAITALEANGKYTFTFLGVADIDAISSGYGLAKGNISFYGNAREAEVKTSSGIAKYMNSRSFGATTMADFYDDTKAALPPLKSDSIDLSTSILHVATKSPRTAG